MKRFKINVTSLVIVTLILGLGGISLLTYLKTKQLLTTNLEHSISTLTLSTGAEVGQWLKTRASEMELMANTPLVQYGNKEDIIAYMNMETRRNKVYEQFFIADTTGQYYLNSGKTGSVLDREYYKSVMATGKTVISEPLISRGSGNQIVVVAAPIKNKGKVVGLLGGNVNIRELNQMVAAHTVNSKFYAFLVSSNGMVIAHPNKDLVMKYNPLKEKSTPPTLRDAVSKMVRGNSGFVMYRFLGENKYAAYAPIPGVNWSLGVAVPVSYITNQLHFLPVYFILITILIGVIMMFLINRWLGIPITRLAKITTEVIGKLDDEVEPNWINSPVSEIESLTRNFRNMVSALKINFQQLKLTNITLEKEIQERIAIQEDLKASYKEIESSEGKLRNNIQKLQTNEKALQESERRFRKMLENIQLFTMMISSNGCITFCNDFMLEVVGYKKEEVIGQDFFNLLISIEERTETRQRFLEMLKSRNPYFPLNNHIQKKNGDMLFVNWNNTMLFDQADNVIGLASIGEDITERKHMEKEIAKLDRLNLVGEMSASLGHEIRNPLTSVRGFLQLLSGKESNDANKDFYGIMIEELDRANSIITEFLSLAKNKAVKFESVSLDEILGALYPLLNMDALKQEKHIVFDKKQVPRISADAREIRQLILNLVRNGLEAMNYGGVVTIGTRLENEQVVLFIKDEGKGIDPGILDKLGNPFVTTKENGTGLGLAVCYSIANRHKAIIDFDTSLSGTTFYVRFKIQEEKNRIAS